MGAANGVHKPANDCADDRPKRMFPERVRHSMQLLASKVMPEIAE